MTTKVTLNYLHEPTLPAINFHIDANDPVPLLAILRRAMGSSMGHLPLVDLTRFKGSPGVPVVDHLDARIARLIEAEPRQFDMATWTGSNEKCGTTHCRGGWAIALAGEAGTELLDRECPYVTAAAIYIASTGRMPRFFAHDYEALADIRAQATLDPLPPTFQETP